MADYKNIQARDKQFFSNYSLKGLKRLAETYQNELVNVRNAMIAYAQADNQDPEVISLLDSFINLTDKADTR
ncbi:MAG: hypothetical protein ABF661_08165 [Oenococcus sp.]|uniref:hypothetical protein n=1 Tax=Oenococcus sp. TaxID=1979414 RepID=UPI0039EAB96B